MYRNLLQSSLCVYYSRRLVCPGRKPGLKWVSQCETSWEWGNSDLSTEIHCTVVTSTEHCDKEVKQVQRGISDELAKTCIFLGFLVEFVNVKEVVG